MNASIVISRKKDFYEFENEVRMAIEYGSGTQMPEGLDVQININPTILIKEVICSPYMPLG
jgi:hypothetical protein